MQKSKRHKQHCSQMLCPFFPTVNTNYTKAVYCHTFYKDIKKKIRDKTVQKHCDIKIMYVINTHK